MGSVNIGNQTLFGKYATSYKASTLKNVFNNIVPPGILYREAAPYVDVADIDIPPCKVAIKDMAGQEGLVLVDITEEVTLTPVAGDDHIIVRYEHIEQKENYADILSIDSAALLDTDIILANISTGPLAVDSVPVINRFDDEQYWNDNYGAIIAPVDDFTNTPPATVEGVRILIGDAGTGIFSGHNFELAVVKDLVWRFYVVARTSIIFNINSGTFLYGQTSVGYSPLGAAIDHADLQNITIDSTTAVDTHLSGAAYFKILLGALGTVPVELVSNTPVIQAGDNKVYLSGGLPEGDWEFHAYELIVDSPAGWIFVPYTTETVVVSKEGSVDKDDWKLWLFKSNDFIQLICNVGNKHDALTDVAVDDYSMPIVHLSGTNVEKLLGGETLDGEHYHLGLLTAGELLEFETLTDGPSSSADDLHTHLGLMTEAQKNVIVGGPGSSADSLHTHPQYGENNAIVLSTEYPQYFLENTEVDIAGLTTGLMRILEHPKYNILFDYTNRALYVYDKTWTLQHSISIATAYASNPMNSVYGWYQDYIILMQVECVAGVLSAGRHIRMFVVDVNTGSVISTTSFEFPPPNGDILEPGWVMAGEAVVSDLIWLDNKFYFGMIKTVMYIPGTPYMHRQIWVHTFDPIALTMGKKQIDSQTGDTFIGTTPVENDIASIKLVVYKNIIYPVATFMRSYNYTPGPGSFVSGRTDIAKVTKDLSAVSAVTYYSWYYYAPSGDFNHDIVEAEIKTFVKVIGDNIKLFHSLYKRFTASGPIYITKYVLVGCTINLTTLNKTTNLLYEDSYPSSDFAYFPYDWEVKSKTALLDPSSAKLFAFDSMDSLGVLNSDLQAISFNIAACTIADNKIFTVVNDSIGGKVWLWILSINGELLHTFEIANVALADNTSGRCKIRQITDGVFELIILHDTDKKLYQVTIIRNQGDV